MSWLKMKTSGNTALLLNKNKIVGGDCHHTNQNIKP